MMGVIMESKVNIGLSISKNYDKITLEMVEEIISYDSDEEFKARVRQKFNILRDEVELEFTKIQGGGN